MKQNISAVAATCIAALFFFLTITFLAAGTSYAFPSIGDAVNTYCAPRGVTPYTGSNCTWCHNDAGNFNAAFDGNYDYFCPDTTPTCTDADGDTYAVEGGDCGPVDCNDADVAINPGATENCSDTIDNNCNGLVDDQDPAAVGCQVCTDNDGDNFALEGGACGPVDCDDTDASINPDAVDIANNGIDENCDGADAVDPTLLDNDGDGYTVAAGDCDDNDPSINPGVTDIPNNGIDENCDGADAVDMTLLDNDGDGFTPATGDCDDTDADVNPDAVEVCTDAIDNDCNGLVDIQDPNAVDCPQTCFDNDGDTYAVEGGTCGPVDCNDNDATINPGSEEICDDGIDNDCDGSVDEGCNTTCPDADGDGYQDALCGGTDCNDFDTTVSPGTAEVCGNGIDENCNGDSDDTCLTCPDGALLVVKEMEYERENGKLAIKGRATDGTTITIINTETNEILADEIVVRRGKWRAKLRDVGSTLNSITLISSNGCALDVPLGADDDDDDDDDHNVHDDDDDHEKEDRRDERRSKRER